MERQAWLAERRSAVVAVYDDLAPAYDEQSLNIDFTGVVFDGGDFGGAQFSGGRVDFNRAEFSGGMVDFSFAEFSGGEVDFSRASVWSSPPVFPWTDTPPSGVKLPRKEDQSQT
jgi:hypothetical protein